MLVWDLEPCMKYVHSSNIVTGGDLKKIQVVGKYMVEVWKAVGMDLTRVEFLSSSEEINKRPDEYWTLVMDIARKNNLKRIVRSEAHCRMVIVWFMIEVVFLTFRINAPLQVLSNHGSQ